MREKSLFDQLYDGIADAVGDIREKVVEEGYFGRSLGQSESHEGPEPQWPQAQAPGSHTHNIEREYDRSTPDLDLDR